MDCSSPYDEVMNNEGEVISPNYPENYNIDQECRLTITLSSGSLVSSQFISFNLEDDLGCKYDWLEIRDGDSPSSPIIGSRLCGSSNPGTIISTGNSVTLIFHSDFSVAASGFKINIEQGKT